MCIPNNINNVSSVQTVKLVSQSSHDVKMSVVTPWSPPWHSRPS